ncbi:MAG: hypothetical protein ABWW70_07645 [Thermoproteota archaeon]
MSWDLLIPVIIGVGVFIYGQINLRLRPLLVGIALAYLSFPIYYTISQLPISYHARVALQVAAFALIFGYVLYTLAKHMEKAREEAR